MLTLSNRKNVYEIKAKYGNSLWPLMFIFSESETFDLTMCTMI